MATRPKKKLNIQIPAAFRSLLQEKARYKVFYGGRGGSKSWAFARALLMLSLQKRHRILCAREFQTSIADSVHKLLCDQIAALGLSPLFTITKTAITNTVGSEFIFKGLRFNAAEIKSLEGVSLCWVEEAALVSKESWELLIPTIRAAESEIWVSFNPRSPSDDTYRRFVVEPPADAIVRKVGWQDNPWFPEALDRERLYCLKVNPAAYQHIWEGEPQTFSEAQVFKDKFEIRDFQTPERGVRFYFGADWGFATDPSALIRAFIIDKTLYLDYEAYGVGVELDELPQFFDSVPESRRWPIAADSARPETISYMRRNGFKIRPAKKGQGSVMEGVELIRSFQRIIIHPRCRNAAKEFSLYSYKVDRTSGDVLPVLQDANNHIIDALRYALEGLTNKMSVFSRMSF